MNILFFGDVVGKIGRKALLENLPILKKKYNADFVIVNAENITHGKGIIKKHYNFLRNIGVDAITLGNHYLNRISLNEFINEATSLIRPVNLIDYKLGLGSKVFKVNGINIRVTNVLCKNFMNIECDDPVISLNNVIKDTSEKEIHIVDLHGEATGEKESIAYYFDGKISAILGTHTHVQTNDLKILPKNTVYLSDVGMCGESISVLGFDCKSVIEKSILNKDGPFQINDNGKYLINGVFMKFNDSTLKAEKVELIKIDQYEYEEN